MIENNNNIMRIQRKFFLEGEMEVFLEEEITELVFKNKEEGYHHVKKHACETTLNTQKNILLVYKR